MNLGSTFSSKWLGKFLDFTGIGDIKIFQEENSFSAKFSSAGVLLSKNADWVTVNASPIATGKWDVNMNTGFLNLTVPPSVIMIVDGGVYNITHQTAPTTSSIKTDIRRTGSEVATNRTFWVHIQKQAPDYKEAVTIRTILGL